MIRTLKFNELAALCLDFVDHSDGFLYLRLVGSETGVNAIRAVLSARDGRGRKWGIPVAGRASLEYLATQKGVTCRTLRTRLPGGMIDLAMVHPRLTGHGDVAFVPARGGQ